MRAPNLPVTAGLSDRAARACKITGFVSFAVFLIALEYWRYGLADALLKNGFVVVPNTSLYARAIAGQSLSFADFPPHIFWAFLALLLSFACYSAIVLIAKLAMGTGYLKAAIALTLTFTILSGIMFWALYSSPPPEILTLDLQSGNIRDGEQLLSLDAVTGFSSYQESGVKSSRQELGAILTSGRTEDLMTLPDNLKSEGDWAAQTMANFLSSDGQTLPND